MKLPFLVVMYLSVGKIIFLKLNFLTFWVMLVDVKNAQIGLTCQASWVAGFGCHADTGSEPPLGNAILGENVL